MTATPTSPIDSLLTRSSLAGSFMKAPAPNEDELQQILGAAQRAADHDRLRPWRFLIVRPEHYEVFYDRLAEAATRVQDDPSRYERNRDKYRLTARAPLLVVAAAKIDTTAKVPPDRAGLRCGRRDAAGAQCRTCPGLRRLPVFRPRRIRCALQGQPGTCSLRPPHRLHLPGDSQRARQARSDGAGRRAGWTAADGAGVDAVDRRRGFDRIGRWLI